MTYKELESVDPFRDNFELDLAKWIFLDIDIRILRINRGVQIAGGSLYQDLLIQKVTSFNHS